MSFIIHHASMIITGQGPRIQPAIMVVEDGKVLAVAHPDDNKIKKYMNDSTARHIDHKEAIIVPGFIDIHTHGALGYDFSDPTQEALNEVSAYFAQEGTTSFLSSTMSKPRPIEKEILQKLGELDVPATGARWIGIHNEGPYLSLKYKAMMEAEGIRPIVKGEIDEDAQWSQHRLRMVTVAPELEGINTFIQDCHRHNIAVMFAHTNATTLQTLDALKAGGDGFTHLYNAMTPHTHRDPGAVTAALLKGTSFCELIVDAYHIDPLVVKLTYQIIGSQRLILITDANPGKGMGDGEFTFGGTLCVSRDGKSYTKENGRIAGSTIGMIDAFRNIMSITECSLEEAVEMSSVNPAKLLKLEKIGQLIPGYWADFTLINHKSEVLSTYRSGMEIYNKTTEKKLYKVLPVFNYRVWGGHRLEEKYGYQSNLVNIGECYNVIAMKGILDCTVEENGEKLSDFFHTHASLFQSDTKEMPVRTAMANPVVPMSIQLHPNDEYALRHEGRKGKPDGVYFIEGEGTMVLGHYAKTKDEFKAMVEAKDYDHLVRTIKVKAGDFVDVPFGTLHAFGGGLTIIEFSQNADLTYRLYDYDRIDPVLKTKRQLHIQEVFDNIRVPNGETKLVQLNPHKKNGMIFTMLHDEPGVYTAAKIEVEDESSFKLDEFYFITILEGLGKLNGIHVKGGETWFVPCHYGVLKIEGKLVLATVSYRPKGKL